MLLTGYQNIETVVPKAPNLPSNRLKSWYHPEEESVSQEEMPHSSDNLSDNPAGETEL